MHRTDSSPSQYSNKHYKYHSTKTSNGDYLHGEVVNKIGRISFIFDSRCTHESVLHAKYKSKLENLVPTFMLAMKKFTCHTLYDTNRIWDMHISYLAIS